MSSTAIPGDRTPVLADLVPWRWVRALGLSGAFSLAIALGAQIGFVLPNTPVPVTAQTFVVLLGAAVLGPVRATAGAAAFLGLGALGLPWFAVSSGTTFGYIAGFVLASIVVGRLARAGWMKSHSRAAAAMVAGNLTIYAAGVTVLGLVLNITASEAIAVGMTPFLLGDAIKIATATTILPWLQRFVEH